ncbi:MAG: V-type ATP synthase subunit I, partial [Lachnospiraceae bacterium]|nr:V-type ATP synthase subunit I [Lachnospiraceae bacterium]
LAENALKVLEDYAPAGGGMMEALKGASQLGPEEWQKRSENAGRAQALAEEILETDRQIAELEARAARAQIQTEGLLPWKKLGIPLDFAGTESCRTLIGALPGSWTREDILALLGESCPEAETYSLELLEGDLSQTPLLLVCLKEEGDRLEEALRRKGFARPLVSTSLTPEDAINHAKFERSAALKEAEGLKEHLKGLGERRSELEFLFDDASLEAARLKAFGKAGEGQRCFFLSGYAPAARAEGLKKKLEDRFTLSVLLSEAEADAPVLLKNNAFASPTESVVESYGLPGEGETDPTSIMAIFYYFLFGLMLSDAGYGLLMVLGCGILLKKFPRMKRTTRQMFTMFFWCGVSTFLWGLLFGGFFGDAIDVIGHTFLGVPAHQPIFKPLWFAPLEKPMKLLVYSFLFGIIHLFVGLGIKGYQLLKQKRTLDFIGGVLSWYLLLIGLILLLIPSDLFASISGSPIPLPAWVQTIAKFLALGGAVGLLLFSAWDRKNIGLRLAMGAYELYGITSWLSDVLSYSRLLALGLATGVIASVINSMASMFGGGVSGLIFFIIIFLVGHTLNMAINLLGAYVHTNRLQYVEFFGKFYDGGGEVFEPLTAQNTKYYHMEEN